MIYYSICVAFNEAHLLDILIGIGSAANNIIGLIGRYYFLEDILKFIIVAVRWNVLENGRARECMKDLVGQATFIRLSLPSIA